MKLKHYNQTPTARSQEFDLWITPGLSEIKDSEKFKEELDGIENLLGILGKRLSNFASINDLSVEALVDSTLSAINKRNLKIAQQTVLSACSLLFLVTGKSDNNCKCQFPLFLRDSAHWNAFPQLRKKNNKLALVQKEIPRTIKSEKLALLVVQLGPWKAKQKALLKEYFSFILDDQQYLNSLWSIGHSYFLMQKLQLGQDFLMPLVIFKVRGSVTASSGHDPENLLRELMASWGMQPDIDYNTTDVIVGKDSTGRKLKTRAYDFVLPYKVTGWENRIFVQCQFYAGDSGSVSHKNVDQTRSSRNFTKTKVENPVFLEYLDGAGYFSSLNSDLRSLLSMPDTSDFFQIKTAPIKLRRQLQKIGFLLPTDFVAALAASSMDMDNAEKALTMSGYETAEIKRVKDSMAERGLISETEGTWLVDETIFSSSRTLYLLDQIYHYSSELTSSDRKAGMILIPGHPGMAGISLSDIATQIIPNSKMFEPYFDISTNLVIELQFLSRAGWIKQI